MFSVKVVNPVLNIHLFNTNFPNFNKCQRSGGRETNVFRNLIRPYIIYAVDFLLKVLFMQANLMSGMKIIFGFGTQYHRLYFTTIKYCWLFVLLVFPKIN